MAIIFVKDREAKISELNADSGMNLMEIIRDAGMNIEAACGRCCACATCHIYVSDKWISKLPQANEDEEAMLDQTFHVKKNSRLACQIEFNEDLDKIEVELAQE